MLNAALAFLYVALGRIAFAASVQYGEVTSVFFAPEGVALAFSVLFGPRILPGIVLGQALLSYWSGPSVLGGLIIGLGNASEAALGGILFHRWRLSPHFTRLRDVGLFAGMVLFILQPISASIGVLTLIVHGIGTQELPSLFQFVWANHGIQQPLHSLHLAGQAWVHWWLGNSLGQLLFAPLLLSWIAPSRAAIPALRWQELLGLALGLASVLLIAFTDTRASALLLLALSYALLVWIGLRCGIRVVTIANLAFAVLIVWLGVRGTGFMSFLSLADRLFHVSFFVATGALFSMLLAALLQERRELIRQLTRQASRDELTELSNRRHFVSEVERIQAAACRRQSVTTLAILDLDHFKRINDTYGHCVGDRNLQAFARNCEAVLRPTDIIGRIGGEEFAVALPETDCPEAMQAVQRLLDRIERHELMAPDGELIRVTASAGLARAVGKTSFSDMYQRADQALYTNTRNRYQTGVWTARFRLIAAACWAC